MAKSDGVDEDLLAFHCQLEYLKSRSGHTGLTIFSWRLSLLLACTLSEIPGPSGTSKGGGDDPLWSKTVVEVKKQV